MLISIFKKTIPIIFCSMQYSEAYITIVCVNG